MFNHKTLLLTSVFSLLALGAKADTTCVKQDCASLGYTKTLAQCAGSDNIIKCPFDSSKMACNAQVDLPVVDLVGSKLAAMVTPPPPPEGSGIAPEPSVAPPTMLSTNLNEFCKGNWSRYVSKFCASIDGRNNITCTTDDHSELKKKKTLQDLVAWAEAKLMYDPCEGFVEFDEYTEICTSYCKTDNTKCMAKRDMTCDEAIRAKGGTVLTNSTVVQTGGKYYLKNNVTLGTAEGGANFLLAADIPACANDSTVSKDPKLTINQMTIKRQFFESDVNTRIENLKMVSSYSTNIDFTVSKNLYINALRMGESSDSARTFYISVTTPGSVDDIYMGYYCFGNKETNCNITFRSLSGASNITLKPHANKGKITCNGVNVSQSSFACGS